MPRRLPSVPEFCPLPTGFRAAGLHCGLKQDGAPDLGLLLASEAVPAAALFTRNELLGAHVPVCREHLHASGGLVRAVLVNSRNANCATGQAGIEAAKQCCAELAQRLSCPTEQVLMVSTGVIGAALPTDRILAHLDALLAGATTDGGMEFARAIMTTDTHAKAAYREPDVTGFAKGSGMIHPNMATMLGFLLVQSEPGHAPTPRSLSRDLRQVADRSFHRVTVDGDTSPNDTLLLLATPSAPAGAEDRDALPSAQVDRLEQISRELAQQLAADGEGATRLVTIEVRGARTEADAARVGRVIATSPLVKTAVAGRDPNWGRIVAAAGRAGVTFPAERCRVWVGETEVYADGVPRPDREAAASQHLRENERVVLGIDLATGDGTAASGGEGADVWTCDLTADYVQINADYRT
ncbi:MAG: bifunctional glutamate N-acetyltransferase/amino-acid acetyltransferase ArgJ [Planctomycetota bacterium]